MTLLERLRTTAIARLQRRSVESLVRLACWVGLVALAIMATSILNPRPLTVIFATSVGQVIGGLAFLCYLVSVVLDVVRGPGAERTVPAEELKTANSDSAQT